MTYVDGMVCAVPTANKEAYREHWRIAAAVFRKRGALSVVEAWGGDVPEGETNSMHTAVMRKNDETVVFSWIVWPSRTVRDEGVKNAMADPAMQVDATPFDGRRVIYGGFEVILET